MSAKVKPGFGTVGELPGECRGGDPRRPATCKRGEGRDWRLVERPEVGTCASGQDLRTTKESNSACPSSWDQRQKPKIALDRSRFPLYKSSLSLSSLSFSPSPSELSQPPPPASIYAMSILGRTRTRSTCPNSPGPKAKAKAPLYPTTSKTSSVSNATPNPGIRLSVGGIANMFIKLRHLERQSKKPYTIACSSGAEPLTHPHVQAGRQADAKAPLVHKDTYICAGNGGVDVVRLLRATRTALIEEASRLGANALVDER